MPLPTPSILLNHPKFTQWYPGQEDAYNKIDKWLRDPSPSKRFLCASMPTGSGKSVLGVLASKLGDKRAAFLTVTKGLQTQLNNDFEQIGMVDIRGQNSYSCRLAQERGDKSVTVDDGACHAGVECEYRQGGCGYYDRLYATYASSLIVTNYSYYLAQTTYGQGWDKFVPLGNPTPINFLVCDEAHMMFQALETYIAVYITHSEIEAMGKRLPQYPKEWSDWRYWADGIADDVDHHLKEAKKEAARTQKASDLRAFKHYRYLARKIETIASSKGNWIWADKKVGYQLTPVWPGEYSHQLFRNTPKILVMSATLSPKTADSLYIPQSQREWLDVPSFFPASNSPIARVKACRMNFRATKEDLAVWLTRIDQIINKRLDRKGIIFGVSYQRCQDIKANSKHSRIMYLHNSKNVVDVVEQFKKAKAPAILVSPTVTSGWDFPGVECEYCIVGKIPYPDSRDPVVKARYKEDKDWGSYLAMQVLVQECGRGTRNEGDKCEYLVVDDNWGWFWNRYKHFAPQFFKDRVRAEVFETVPEVLI